MGEKNNRGGVEVFTHNNKNNNAIVGATLLVALLLVARFLVVLIIRTILQTNPDFPGQSVRCNGMVDEGRLHRDLQFCCRGKGDDSREYPRHNGNNVVVHLPFNPAAKPIMPKNHPGAFQSFKEKFMFKSFSCLKIIRHCIQRNSGNGNIG
jgi:hypothetical protein